ncbi:MAG: hypothetical protein EOO20_11785 [Chryseobacterium sp.]|nr:MAG: hypothetical protein EOO20_11785 [Chryseobacterium sp.]
MYKIDKKKLKNSPRPVRFWECSLAVFNELISRLGNVREKGHVQHTLGKHYETGENDPGFFLNRTLDYYCTANQYHMPGYSLADRNKVREQIFQYVPLKQIQHPDGDIYVQEVTVSNGDKNLRPVIAVANTRVKEENILAGIRGLWEVDHGRGDKLRQILESTRQENADILLFPECFIPMRLLDEVSKFAVSEQVMVVTGVEHVTVGGVSYNFIVTILPFMNKGIKDAVISYRLKNHYSHGESLLIKANHVSLPVTTPHIYDLFIWNGIYFSSYYCFELADVHHRSLFKGKIDLLIASEFNPDVNYFSNIVESISRDIHAYVAQVNTSQFGDTRITRPSRTEIKDILKLKGGINDTILTGQIDLIALREFQRELYIKTKDDKRFKPLPPNYSLKDVLRRIKGQSIFGD